ncbi:zinc ribbon domain-containing protein [bacterium]|nr:zinc ribbon domain-containing protein [bacterium]
MECPNCGYEVDNNTLVCPNCKKVLKLVCPVCKTINTTNTCKRCGYQIMVKCHNCGKVNKNINKKCSKCGFSTELSCILKDANTEDYAMMIIEFPNMDEITACFGSQLITKFKNNLDKVVKASLKKFKLNCRIYGKKYVVRILKEYTFKSSASLAFDASLDMLQEITKLNCKLDYKKNILTKCSITLVKRNVNDDPENVDSNFNIKLINAQNSTEDKILGAFQVLVDNNVCNALQGVCEFEQLDAGVVNNERIMYYEAKINDRITMPEIIEDEKDEIEVPNFVQNMMKEAETRHTGENLKSKDTDEADKIFDMEKIELDDVCAEFMRVDNADAFFHIVNRLQSYPKGILSIRTDEYYRPYSLKLISDIQALNIYKNIICVTCSPEMQYLPYAFFRELIMAIYNFSVSQRLFDTNDFSWFEHFDPDLIIKDLISLKYHDNPDILNTRNSYFDIFAQLLQAIPDSLVFIEDFDKADPGSLEIMKLVFDVFDDLKISFLISYDKKFSLHKYHNRLLQRPEYCEILLKPSDFKKVVEDNKELYKNILNSFYFQRIAKYCCGSVIFIDHALQYLLETNVFVKTNEGFRQISNDTVVMPATLSKLMKRRLNFMKNDHDMLKFLTSLVLLGSRVDMATVKALSYKEADEFIQKLSEAGFIYFYNDCIYFPNYNLLKNSIMAILDKPLIEEITQDFNNYVFVEGLPSYTKVEIAKFAKDYKNEFMILDQLAQVNMSLGDLYAYLSCANRILELINKYGTELVEDPQAYKISLYDSVAQNIFDNVNEIDTDVKGCALRYFESVENIDKIIELSLQIINSCMQDGDYNRALLLIHKFLTHTRNSTLDIKSPYFDKYLFFMSLIHVDILFNLGALNDCIDLGYKILNIVTAENIPKIIPEGMDSSIFMFRLFDTIGFVALANILCLNNSAKRFLDIIKQDLPSLPVSYGYLGELENLLMGRLDKFEDIEIIPDDRFAETLHYIIYSFMKCKDDTKAFSENIYKAKLSAKNQMLHKFEFFCDLLMAHVCIVNGNFKKAEHIIVDVIQSGKDKGIADIQMLAWYLMSCLYLKEKQYDLAYGVINNALIFLEKSAFKNDYISMILKYNLYKVFVCKRDMERAQICMQQAVGIAQKYGVNYPFNEIEPPPEEEVKPVPEEENNEYGESDDEDRAPGVLPTEYMIPETDTNADETASDEQSSDNLTDA